MGGSGSGRKFPLGDFDIRGREEVHCVLVIPIGYTVDDARDPGIDQRLGAIDAGEMRDVAG